VLIFSSNNLRSISETAKNIWTKLIHNKQRLPFQLCTQNMQMKKAILGKTFFYLLFLIHTFKLIKHYMATNANAGNAVIFSELQSKSLPKIPMV